MQDDRTEDQQRAALWEERATKLLERAIGEVGETDEVFGMISAADACLRIAYGELAEEELPPYWYETEEEAKAREEAREAAYCTCGAERRAAGGFISSCPVHGRGA